LSCFFVRIGWVGLSGGERFLKASLRQSGRAFGPAIYWHA
jgi:hypothetical protein